MVKTDLHNPDWNKAQVVVSEKENKLEYFERSKDYLLLVYSDGINMHLYKLDFKTEQLSKIKTP